MAVYHHEPYQEGFLALAVGSRIGPDGDAYPVDETAVKYGAGVEVETTEPSQAYARFSKLEASRYPGELLPG